MIVNWRSKKKVERKNSGILATFLVSETQNWTPTTYRRRGGFGLHSARCKGTGPVGGDLLSAWWWGGRERRQELGKEKTFQPKPLFSVLLTWQVSYKLMNPVTSQKVST